MTDVLHPSRGFAFGHRAGVCEASRGAREVRGWAGLAIGALGVAGVFALLLALSRVPGIERVFAWPLNFFAKGLVIHVVFSLVVWFLAVFAALVTRALAEVTEQGSERLAWLGPAGLVLVAASFPLLFLPAFSDDSVASLNNYIPVIIHPAYYLGLLVLFAGVACPALRLVVNLPPLGSTSPFAFAMAAGCVIYLSAIACFSIAFALSIGSKLSSIYNEHLFWGGGHILQFLNTLMMLTGWFLVAQATIGKAEIPARPYRLAAGLLGSACLIGPLFYRALPAFSPMQQDAFRYLQFVLGFPAMAVALPLLLAVVRTARAGGLPWRDPGFLALVLSPIVFGVGGVMGLLISGADTRTPAHYHGMIAGVNLACMGLMLRVLLPEMTGRRPAGRALNWQIALFGLGQLAACIGLFWAGGYGAPRKMAAGTTQLLDGAVAGMYLNGIGALLAVAGGTMFVVTVARALWRAQRS
jgi:hypothetical protein